MKNSESSLPDLQQSFYFESQGDFVSKFIIKITGVTIYIYMDYRDY